MKKFLKLIVSIIVILVIGVTVYFLLRTTSEYNKNNVSEDILNNSSLSGNFENILEQDKNDENEIDNQPSNQPINNGHEYTNQSGEIFNKPASGEQLIINTSGDNTNIIGGQLTPEKLNQIINNANMIENQNNNATVINTLEDNVGTEIIGIEYQELLNMLEANTLSVNVQTAGTMVYILPVSDFVNNQQYHYDEEGNLVLYVNELMGIGGELRYYFYNDQLIKNEETVDGELFVNYETSNEILQRANLVYNKYFK